LLSPPALLLPQITPEEYKAAREELRTIDARPIKKVVEAKARKAKRLHMRLTTVSGGDWGCACLAACLPAGLGRWALVAARLAFQPCHPPEPLPFPLLPPPRSAPALPCLQARQKAESVANQEDVPMKQKMREIEKLYAQARAGKKGKGKGKGAAGGSRTDQYKQQGPRLDARMRSDKRGQDKVAKRMKGAGKKATAPRGAGGGPKNNKAGKNRRR
jgi:hypothetical protein